MGGRHARRSPVPAYAAAAALAVGLTATVGILAMRDDESPASASGTNSTQSRSATGSATTPANTTGGAECAPDAAPLHVLVAPELDAVTQAAAERVTASDPCRTYTVDTAADREGVTAAQADQPPQVWVPDSVTWLDALSSQARDRYRVDAGVAQSPIALARPAGADGAAPASWADVVRGSEPLKLADPDRDAASRLAFYTAWAQRSGPLDRAAGSRLVLLSRYTKNSTSALLKDYETKPDDASAFPISERAAYAFDRQRPTEPLVLAFPRTGTPVLDYPWLSLKQLSAAQARDMEALRAELDSSESRDALTAAGFRVRGADDAGPKVAGRSARPTIIDNPESATREEATAQWDLLRTDMRMLAVIDVSGSMAWDSGTPGQSRMDVLLGSAGRALGTLAAGSEIGAWVFSTAQDGPKQDWRQLVTIRRLDAKVNGHTQRDELRRQLARIPSRIQGDTGLYDTTLAAFLRMRDSYDGNFVNSVVLMTDGVNDDTTGGLGLRTLLSRLKDEFDPDRPVRVVTIGMGEADASALKQISAATGGTSYIANRAEDIDRVLVQALLARPLPVAK
ncbi:substrate-binding domain-containing protein [Nostocoides australiense]